MEELLTQLWGKERKHSKIGGKHGILVVDKAQLQGWYLRCVTIAYKSTFFIFKGYLLLHGIAKSV